MASSPRRVSFQPHRRPSLASPCLLPRRDVTATPDEVMAEIFAALAPLPARLEVAHVSNTAIHIFDPSVRPLQPGVADDQVVGVIIRFGLLISEVAEAIFNLYRTGLIPSDEPPPL